MRPPLPIFALGVWLACCSASAQEARTPIGVLENLAIRDVGGSTGGLDVSPDNRLVALIERETRLEENDYVHHVVIVDIRSGLARVIGDAGGFVEYLTASDRRQGAAALRRPLFSPSGDRVAFLNATDAGVVVDAVANDGGASMRLIDGPGDVRRFAWASENALVVDMSTSRGDLAEDERRFRRDGFLVEPSLEPMMGLLPEPDLRRGRAFFVADLVSGARRPATEDEIALLEGVRSSDPASVTRRQIAVDDGVARIARAPGGGDGDAPAVALSVTLSAGQHIVCALPECSGEISGPLASRGGEILFQRVEAPTRTTTALYAWSPLAGSVRRVRSLEDVLIDCQDAGRELVCLREATTEPRRLVAIDVASGRMRTLHDPNVGWAPFALTRIERIDVEDAFGNPAFGHLVWPAHYDRRRRYPLVIVQYRSRGFLRAGVGGEYPIHALAQRGYFVLSVERPRHVADRANQSRLAAQVEEEFGGLEQRSKLSALEALIDRALARGSIDAHRIGITGMSDGAETAYWAIQHSDRFAVAVMSSPPLDPMTYSLVSERFALDRRARQGRQGPWPDTSEPWASHWRDKPLVNHVEEIDTPVLLQLADREALPAFPFYRRMREQGRAAEMFIYPDAFHAKTRPRQVLAAQLRAIAWLDFWLRDVELADPDDPERFLRWRAWRGRARN